MTPLELTTILSIFVDALSSGVTLLTTLQTQGNRPATPAEWDAVLGADARERLGLVAAIADRKLTEPAAKITPAETARAVAASTTQAIAAGAP